MVAGFSNAEEQPEYERREQHGQQRGEDHLHDRRCGQCEITADEVDDCIFCSEIEEDGDAREESRELPFPLFEKWLDSLHQEAHGAKENDRVAKA